MLLLKLPVMAKAWKVTVTGRNSQGHLMISLQVPHCFSNTPYTQKLFSLKLLFIVYLFYSSEYFKNLKCSTIILFGNTLTGSFKLLNDFPKLIKFIGYWIFTDYRNTIANQSFDTVSMSNELYNEHCLAIILTLFIFEMYHQHILNL